MMDNIDRKEYKNLKISTFYRIFEFRIFNIFNIIFHRFIYYFNYFTSAIFISVNSIIYLVLLKFLFMCYSFLQNKYLVVYLSFNFKNLFVLWASNSLGVLLSNAASHKFYSSRGRGEEGY